MRRCRYSRRRRYRDFIVCRILRNILKRCAAVRRANMPSIAHAQIRKKHKSFARLFKGGRGCRGAKPPCEKWNAKRSSGKMSKQWRQTIRWMVCRNAFAVPQAVYVWPDSPLAESLDESLKCAPTMNRPQIVPASRRNADRKKYSAAAGQFIKYNGIDK